MSGKEPLLGALKVCILNFQEGNSPYTDTCPHLQSFCEILEMILQKGLKQPVLGFKRKDYWHWLEQLPQQASHHSSTLLSMMIGKTSSCEKVLTAQGRGRYFLRLALNRKLLAVAVQQLIRTPRLLECYNPITSILNNEEFSDFPCQKFAKSDLHDPRTLHKYESVAKCLNFDQVTMGMLQQSYPKTLLQSYADLSNIECSPFSEPFFSMMLVVTEMNFSLDLQNSSFLDESWQLPVCQTYETVPCRELGMVLRYLDRRVFIIRVLPKSQAEVDEVVLAGDVIDEINGSSLRNACNGQAGSVLQKLKGKPLSFRLIRWKWHDGGMFKPLLPYLKILREKIPSFQLQHDHKPKEENAERSLQGDRLLYNLRYLGLANVGKYRGRDILDVGVSMVLDKDLPQQEILFDLKETEVIVQHKTTSKVLFRYSHTDICCVGHGLDSHNIFAFCSFTSPDSPEDSTFDCLVFQSNSEKESEEIIEGIVAGFKQAECFV